MLNEKWKKVIEYSSISIILLISIISSIYFFNSKYTSGIADRLKQITSSIESIQEEQSRINESVNSIRSISSRFEIIESEFNDSIRKLREINTGLSNIEDGFRSTNSNIRDIQSEYESGTEELDTIIRNISERINELREYLEEESTD